MRFGILTLDLTDPLAFADVTRFERFAVHFVESDDIAERRYCRSTAAAASGHAAAPVDGR